MTNPRESDNVASRVVVEGDMARVTVGSETEILQVRELPSDFIEWQLSNKALTYDAIERNEPIAFDPGHLPVIGTWSGGKNFPNLANKGIGFSPRDEFMDRYLDLLERAVQEIQAFPPEAIDETRSIRTAAARELYSHPEHIDWRRMVLLEIFEGNTMRNLRKHPFATVLWTGNAPTYTSLEANCLVEIIAVEDSRYRFAWAMRRLFEYESFHVVQTVFPYAYCFWVHDCKDKTPRRRHSGRS